MEFVPATAFEMDGNLLFDALYDGGTLHVEVLKHRIRTTVYADVHQTLDPLGTLKANWVWLAREIEKSLGESRMYCTIS